MEIDAEATFVNFSSPISTDSCSPNTGTDNGMAFGVTDHTMLPSYPPLSTYGTMAEKLFDPSFPNNHFAVNHHLHLHPAMPGPGNTAYDEAIDLESIEMLLNEPFPDLGPPPVPIRLPRQDEEPPRIKESAYAPPPDGLTTSISNPNSPSELYRRRTTHLTSTESLRTNGRSARNSRSSARSPRNFMHVRATSPMFPDHSTPLVSHHSSTTSLTSTKSDPFGTISSRHSHVSDPGVYAIQNNNSSVNSPAAMSTQDSPKFVFAQTQLPQVLESTTRSSMELEMPIKFVRKIVDLDKRILKLQAERAKWLEKAQQTKSETPPGVEEKWIHPVEKSPENGRIHLYIFPIGIYALDEPLYEEANSLLRRIGGLHFDLHSSILVLKNVCYKGMIFQPDISTCFAFIKSLLQDGQKLKLAWSITGVYRIQLDTEPSNPDAVPQELVDSLSAANEVLKAAQHMTLVHTHIETKLQHVKEMAMEKLHSCDNICQKLGIIDRERRNQIKSVVEGNCTTLSSAERVWPQFYQMATETIQAITECIHPSS